MKRPSQKIINSQLRVAQRAATIANEMAREQLLGDSTSDAVAARLAVMRKRNAAVVKESWNPFVADVGQGLALRLRESDAMLLADLGLLSLTDEDMQLIANQGEFLITNVANSIRVGKMIQQIVGDAMTQAIIENDGNFVRTMLDDLLTGGEQSYYAQMEDRSIVSKVRESWRNR